ncbi:M20 aminoacylase family protein [Serratia oryzae]|uniref:Amidohydrolase n=1 Tax=Serratia oryzae TaxID=2034155 RepID=A0A1S8CFN3_9GAMM|nr:M20 aminoacylase family protein [Serratia oryzae]OMQ20790.1 amidohydrolase [Serratia oryzae]
MTFNAINLDIFKEYAAESQALRQHIHQHPELGYKEQQTADLVAEKLAAWGYQVTRGLGVTGVVGTLKKGDSQRAIGIRADMDALPIVENTGLPYSSVHHGIMHACGHDGHTAMLLGAAHYLADHPSFNGTLNLIFQPAEEGLAGAQKMMDDGLFEQFPCDAIFAMHNMPGFPEGQFVFGEGAFMASSDNVTIRIHGKGGHGAMPKGTVDAVVVGSSIVMALQTIVSRNLGAQEPGVITVGSFQSGIANNVIADSAVLKLSVRALDPAIRDVLEERITTLVKAQAAAFGATVSIDYVRSYPVLVNNPEMTQFAKQVALNMLGEQHSDQVIDIPEPLMGSEDFAFMLQQRPGSYLLLGNGAGENSCMVHNPGYDFNDGIITRGIAYWSALTQAFLK